MVTNAARKVRGIAAASTVALLQGAEGVIFSFFGLVSSVAWAVIEPNFSAAVILLRETLLLAVLLMIFAPRLRSIWQKLKSRGTASLLISGIFTSLGNVFYIIGVATAGSSYGVVLTALYPVLSLLLLRILFKERQNRQVWIGSVISVLSGLLFMMLPSLIGLNGKHFAIKRFLGMLSGLGAAFFWACEGIFIKRSIDLDAAIVKSPIEQMVVRTTSSWLSTVCLIFPLSFAFGNTIQVLSDIVHSGYAMLIVAIIALNLLILRWIHLFSIRTIGPRLTATIDTNNFLVPAFCAIFLSLANWKVAGTNQPLFEPFIWWAWLLVVPLFIGVFMVVRFERATSTAAVTALEKNV